MKECETVYNKMKTINDNLKTINDMNTYKIEIVKNIVEDINNRFTQKCEHVFVPAKDGTGDLKCNKCGQRAMQSYLGLGLKSETSCIDEYHNYKEKNKGCE